MSISLFELLKIGIGPSSSHTVGPMVAAGRFLDEARDAGVLGEIARIHVRLYGSLAFTGEGHQSDTAVLLGLAGETPDGVDPDRVPAILQEITEQESIVLGGKRVIAFDRDADLVFDYGEPLPAHANGMRFQAFDGAGVKLAEAVYYSIGGGFVASEDEMAAADDVRTGDAAVPYPFASAAELLAAGGDTGKTIAEMVLANETVARDEADVLAGIDRIWSAMRDCMERGMKGDGILPGVLHVKRRAKQILDGLESARGVNAKLPHECMDWISLYAIAVNEENASGGRVVTAPTNGAAGVIPAVLRYYVESCPGADEKGVRDFLLTATAIGSLIKLNASISGAEVGCQGEVGSASAMAAAGLAAALGGSNEQVENAAEIAVEHHLGLTCDPIGGLVQVPCIERNAMGAVKAINAASLALKGDGTHFVSLDAVIETMRQTGEDMQDKYKETSLGGLAVNVVEC